MRDWQLLVAVDRDGGGPLFAQVSRQIVAAILDGRLPGGAALPGSRTLARDLGVHRNTVLAAYDALFAEGWVTTTPARGTFVTGDLSVVAETESVPQARRRSGRRSALAPRTPPGPGFPVPGPAPIVPLPSYRPGHLVLSRAAPDVRLFPRAELARAYRRVLDRPDTSALTYADPRGNLALREVLSEMLASRRGLPGGPQSVMVTRGSQMAVILLLHGLLRPGDAIAVEELSNPVCVAAMRQAGLRVVPIRLDAHGLVVDELARAVQRCDVRAVLVTPHHQFPTTTVMPSARRLRLLDLARGHGLIVIEDDYDHEYHYEGRPVLPLASLDRGGSVVYVGTLSKVLAPGLRIGYLRAAPAVIERLASLRALIDMQGDHLLESALAELFRAGDIGRHLRRMVRIYRRRRDVMLAAIEEHLGDVLTVASPAGGMALWAEVDPAVDLDEWCRRGEAAGVSFLPGRVFAVDGAAVQATRLGFTFLDEDDLRRAVRRMRRALPPAPAGGSRRAGRQRARAVRQ